jgi:hypothetical protein
VLLHVAAVDGRHGERPARARPAPTLPRQGLGFWRSAPEGLRELAEERRAERRSAGAVAVAGGAGSVPPTRMAPPCWGGGGVSLALASEPRVWGEGRDGTDSEEDEGDGPRAYTRTRGAFGRCKGGSACAWGVETASVGWVESGQLRHGRLGA